MSTSSKQILFFGGFPPPFTGQRVATKIVHDRLKKNGADIEIVELNYRYKSLDASLNLNTIVSKLVDSVKAILALRKAMKSLQPKMTYFVPSASVFGIIRDYFSLHYLKRESTKKVIAHVHSGNFHRGYVTFFPLNKVFAMNIRKIDLFIFLSPLLSQRLKGIPEHQRRVINNALDSRIEISYETCKSVIAKRMESSKPIRLLYLSNLTPSKGYLDLVKAVGLLKDSPVVVELSIIGDSPDKIRISELHKLIADLGISKEVKFLGRISDRSQIAKAYMQHDIFCLPTYYPTEAQPLTIIEAMNFGLPIITTAHAGIPDMVAFGKNAVKVEKNSSKAIVQAIISLNDNNKRAEFGRKSRKLFEAHFSSKVVTNEILDVFAVESN
ncbi:MAG: glycosyltransferase family 4 protein [Cyclobacteriaceae bacterium]